MKPTEIIIRVSRGTLTESIHRGHMAVVNTDGQLLRQAGSPHRVTFARSALKPIQALPVVESGAAERYGLTDAELALLCASHNGEEQHVEAAKSILGKLGSGEELLQCGAHEPYHPATAQQLRQRGLAPTSLHNNCSGKHSGMLALSAYLQADPRNYMSLEHPVQQLMLDIVSAMSSVLKPDIGLGIDGCGVPVFAMPLDRLALAFARLGCPEGLPPGRADACRRIIRAMRSYPEYVAGSDRFDTRLIKVTNGRILGKMGAEGVFAVTVPEKSLGIAVKIEDGQLRALYPAVAEALRQLGLLDDSELSQLAAFHRPTLTNWQGVEIGGIAAELPD